MGRIKKLIETELVGGSSSTDIYPVTSTKAVYDTNNRDLDTILGEIDSRESSLENRTSELESNKLSKGDLAQSTGSSTTTAMSQDAVTKELGDIEDKIEAVDSNLLRVGSTGYPSWEANRAYNEGDVVYYNGQLVECMLGGSPASEEFNPDDWEATTVDQQSKKRDTTLQNNIDKLSEITESNTLAMDDYYLPWVSGYNYLDKEECISPDGFLVRSRGGGSSTEFNWSNWEKVSVDKLSRERDDELEARHQVLTEDEYNALEDKDDNKFYYTYEEE